ncbi:pyridoxamine 5'-phosphate oxidase [Williamwhitmania taraxaci]|uniref:Pyridoxine/pyridoxamine 5'-phosphate oxidase n=1 Tax=Williamwhitmania taraxaci TaxID=1640674 RepID=A0A1G6IRR8_9BACT|nr:pyridoxamine 5'-phosphate oxidase [Williamwhitmania taraxaci]SDC09262.1 Pyridoxamine 5'-phosphate oxidase [Williamwhitmania taraxaci]
MKKDIANIRQEYRLASLLETEVDTNPMVVFNGWLQEAIKADVPEPTAMTVATSTFEGKPSARMMLLKGADENGFSFFTNYESRKARQLAQNPFAALVFFWPLLERQVRIEGKISKVSAKESDRYFKSRPVGSRIGAWASPQSQVIPNRRYLESLKMDFQEEFAKREIIRPDNWGGYVLEPILIEFWQGRPDRLHDRLQYRLENEGWILERLAP